LSSIHWSMRLPEKTSKLLTVPSMLVTYTVQSDNPLSPSPETAQN
jgi:hypothetical protein